MPETLQNNLSFSDQAPDLFDKMPLPRFVVQVSSGKYLVVRANDLSLKYFDASSDKILGQDIGNFMGVENMLHFEQAFETCYVQKTSVTVQAVPKIPNSVRVYGFFISPVLNTEGEVAYLDVIGQLDLTDRGILQRERDDALSMIASIFEISELGIIITNEKGKIVRANSGFSRTFGWPHEDLVNADFGRFIVPEDREEVQQAHRFLILSGESRSGEMNILRSDGSKASTLITSSTLELSQKRRFQVTTLMDISDRKKMEVNLRQARDDAQTANRAKSAFLANMSHELRTPMNAIIGFSEMIMRQTFGKLGHKKYNEYIADVHGSACHLLEIINQVLDMSKIEAGRMELLESDFSLQDTLNAVMRISTIKSVQERVTITLDIDSKINSIYGDERMFRQIFINLLTNAVKFSDDKVSIKISARVLANGNLRIRVADNGTGISEDKIEKALEPFGQVYEQAEKAHNQGTGLGLPLTKAMIEMHEGKLEIKSEEEKGTRVIITVPAHRVRVS